MRLVLYLLLGCLALDVVILIIVYIGLRFIQPRWPEWWEQWIAAPYPDEGARRVLYLLDREED